MAKWKKRGSVSDLKSGPKKPVLTVLSPEDEAIVVAFRHHTLLPLDGYHYALQPTIPHLTRPSLHRCLQRHDISRLPDVEGTKPAKKKFNSYPTGYFHIDITEVQTVERKLYFFVAIDRTSKFAYAEFHPKAGKIVAAQFLGNLIAAVPYAIYTVLTDNDIQFTNRASDIHAFTHIFDRVCRQIRWSLQFRPKIENAQRSDTLRIYLQIRHFRARTLQYQLYPANAGTKQLDFG